MGSAIVSRGVNRQYAAFVRAPGCRNWRILGPWRRSKRAASRALIDAMQSDLWKRGMVVFRSDYYEPTPVLTVQR